MFNVLLRPFSYLTIDHRSKLPRFVNWILPILISVAIVGLAYFFKMEVNIFGGDGLVSRTLGFVQNLPGFYIAALAVIATFNSEDIDAKMSGQAPTMVIPYNGYPTKIELTRRRFLLSLFAYLTAISFVIVLFSLVSLSLAAPLMSVLPKVAIGFSKAIVVVCYLVLVCQMLTITFWGICYLGEKIYTAES